MCNRKMWFWIILYANAFIYLRFLYKGLGFGHPYAGRGKHREWKFCNFAVSCKILFYWLSLWVLHLVTFIALLACFVTCLMNSNILRNLLGMLKWILLITVESRNWEESNGGYVKPLSSVKQSSVWDSFAVVYRSEALCFLLAALWDFNIPMH